MLMSDAKTCCHRIIVASESRIRHSEPKKIKQFDYFFKRICLSRTRYIHQ